MTTNATTVTGQCQWRPEGRRYPRLPSPPPDPLLSDPGFLGAIDAMAHMASASSAPPPADGLRHFSSPLFHSCTRSGTNSLYVYLEFVPLDPICMPRLDQLRILEVLYLTMEATRKRELRGEGGGLIQMSQGHKSLYKNTQPPGTPSGRPESIRNILHGVCVRVPEL